MKTTRYFEKQIAARQIQRAWVVGALENEAHREVQSNGRIRIWGWVEERGYYFRIVLLEDGETLLNAFPDRNFTKQRGAPRRGKP